jgi:hypothetical protein
MSGIDTERLAAWASETRRIGFERRDWRVVRRLGGVTVGLLAGGLAADLTEAPRAVKLSCWIGAALSGAAMLVWMYDRRRFVKTPDL